MTLRTILERAAFALVILLTFLVLMLVAATPGNYLVTKAVYGAF